VKTVREEEVKLRKYIGFVKQVGFKPEVKERERVIDVQNGESEEEEVTGEGISESEVEELVPE